MNWLSSILLGVIQGLTEFLPVSSSGHLLFFEQLFKFGQPELVVIAMHFATLLAVVVYFWTEIRALTIKQWLMIGIGNIPALSLGYLSKDWLVEAFGKPERVGLALLITAIINFGIVKKMKSGKLDLGQLDWRQIFGIGCFQAFAIIPGISRSGSTILAGLVFGLKQESAFKFSFLLSLPAILAASGYEVWQLREGSVATGSLMELLVGAAAAFATGYVALWLLRRWLNPGRWQIFVVYTALVGLLMLLLASRLG